MNIMESLLGNISVLTMYKRKEKILINIPPKKVLDRFAKALHRLANEKPFEQIILALSWRKVDFPLAPFITTFAVNMILYSGAMLHRIMNIYARSHVRKNPQHLVNSCCADLND